VVSAYVCILLSAEEFLNSPIIQLLLVLSLQPLLPNQADEFDLPSVPAVSIFHALLAKHMCMKAILNPTPFNAEPSIYNLAPAYRVC
jgi:hypothetical protein